MSEAALLRTLADKLDELDQVTAYPTEVTDPGEVTVSWTEGADHPGYTTLSAAMASLVTQHWNALRSQVIKHRESEVHTARAALQGAGADKASVITASVEAALRKVAS